MNAARPCPPNDQLRQLLDGSLSGEQQQDCVQHMDSCTDCQTKLEQIATDGSNLSQVVEHLNTAEPAATSAYWPALRALDSADSASIATSRTSTRTRELSLDFLQPPTDAAYLGRLAHFDVMRILGRGGMGVVLEAFDSRLQRNVAVKVLDPELADDEVSRQRFCREARAAASITHENVVAVHQVEKSDGAGLPYLVMQLISGESLEQRLVRERQLPLREIVRIGMQAAHGLAAAHAQGLIHRDVKPGNILLEGSHDNVKLTDFGLARVEDDVKLTRTGFVSGTPLYMAPEQAMGEQADQRSDLFSLGTILYEMSTGEPPFDGPSALAILKQITEAPHRPVRELNPAIPEWLARTIDQLLEKRPEDRIQSAEHLAELFEFEWALMKTTSDDVPTVCLVEQRKRVIRNRWIAATVGAVFLTLGIVAGALFFPRAGTPEPPMSASAPLAVLSGNSGAVWSVSFDPHHQALAMAIEDGTVRVWDVPSASVKATLPAHRGVVWSAEFSRDGTRLATGGDDGLVKIWDPAQSEPLHRLQHPSAVRALALAHDGRRVFTAGREGGVRAWQLDGEYPLVEAQQSGALFALALSPDDQTLATAGSDKVVRLWNADTLSAKLSLEGHNGPVYGLAFSPDGRRLASVGWDRTIRLWDTGSGSLVRSWEGHAGDIWAVAFSPDGKQLASGGHDGAVKLWNAESGELLATYLGHQLAIHSIAFYPDGTQLASGSRDGTVRIWHVD